MRLDEPKSIISSNQRIFETLQQRGNTKLVSVQYADTRSEDDLFYNFRGFLILGRILGVIPCSGVFKRSYKDLKGSVYSAAGLISIVCILIVFSNAFFAVWRALQEPKRNALEIATSLSAPFFTCWGLFVYVYYFLRRHAFIKIFRLWDRVIPNLTYYEKDASLYCSIVCISAVILTSGVLENAVLHMKYFVVFDHINGHIENSEDRNSNKSVLEVLYWRGHFFWATAVGYHPVLAIIAVIAHKLVLYAGNYTDVMMALFCRALYYKFKALWEKAEQVLVQPIALEKFGTFVTTKSDQQAWNLLCKDHAGLCEILDALNDFFSLPLFMSYTVNIYFFCMQLQASLNPDIQQGSSVVHTIYAPWSFIHIVVRMFVLMFCVASVHDHANKIRNVIIRCPVESYDVQLERLDKKVSSGSLGFSPLGCFVVTRNSMLGVLNVVFTIEIVLLQGSPSPGSSSSVEKCTPQKTILN